MHNRIVSAYLEIAEIQAMNRNPGMPAQQTVHWFPHIRVQMDRISSKKAPLSGRARQDIRFPFNAWSRHY